jgi:CRP/FNR family transcriptional regulator, nitrogen oxide reductase regulator
MTSGPHLAPKALAALELFDGLPRTALDAVLASARVRRLPRESIIFNQGDPRVRVHALIEGGVRISQTGSDGAQVVIRFIGPGEMFGTVALFTDGQYPGDAVTLIDSLEVSWSEAELLNLMTRHPQIAINIIRVSGKRLQEAQERIRELSTQRAERRVAHSVLRLARQAGRRTAEGTTIEFPLRRKDIADTSGTTLHTASRILTAWEKAGLLSSQNQRLTLRDPSEILRIAEGTAN